MITFGIKVESIPLLVRRCAYAVVAGEAGRVAAVLDGGKFFLPGGGIEAGESAADAVHREVAEELGCAVTLGENLGDTLQYSLYEGCCYELRATFFRAALLDAAAGEAISMEHEHELLWVTPEELHHPCQAWAATEAAQAG
jgi:8-oxo-dGTP diphosphatase